MLDSTHLISSKVKVRETDLHILAAEDLLGPAEHLVRQFRNQLENYIVKHPGFQSSLQPLAADFLAPPIIKEMLRAGEAAGVGPMAAVAGVMAEFVGRDLLFNHNLEEIMVENGGDIFLQRQTDCTIAIFAGPSPLSNKVGIRVSTRHMPLGICTSSASVGHSLSLGQADAVTVLSSSVALADAAATRLGNEVKKDLPLGKSLDKIRLVPGVMGALIIRGQEVGAWGEIELCDLSNSLASG